MSKFPVPGFDVNDRVRVVDYDSACLTDPTLAINGRVGTVVDNSDGFVGVELDDNPGLGIPVWLFFGHEIERL